MLNWLKTKINIAYEITKIPYIKLSLGGYKEIYQSFTARHPKLPVFQRKTIGVALIDNTGDFDKYLSSINGKNSAAYYARKANRHGYKFMEINPNDYLNDIYNVNTSKEYRQGQMMSASYTQKTSCIEIKLNYRYYGVLAEDGILVAYAWVPCCGDVWIINTLLGHGEHLNNGVMYLLVTSIVREMFNISGSEQPKYLMYDMWYGAKPGLQMFKRKLGFKPYRVKWIK